MNLIMCVVIPVVLVLCLLFACKWTNFSVIPEELRIPPPSGFEFPKLKRDGYKWYPEKESSSSYGEDSFPDENDSSNNNFY